MRQYYTIGTSNHIDVLNAIDFTDVFAVSDYTNGYNYLI